MRRNKDNKQTNEQNKQKHKQKQKMTERIIFSCNFRLEEKKIENGYFFEPPKSIWHETLLKKDQKKSQTTLLVPEGIGNLQIY